MLIGRFYRDPDPETPGGGESLLLVEDGPLDPEAPAHVEGPSDPNAPEDPTPEPEPRKFEYSGEQLTRDALLEKVDDDTLDNLIYAHERKSNWEKSNTEKAQETADLLKTVQPLRDFQSELTKNPELREAIDDVYKDIMKTEAGISESLTVTDLSKVPNPFKAELDEALGRAEAIEAETRQKQAAAELKAETEALQKPHDQGGYALTDRQIDAVAKDVMKRFQNDGVMRSMEEVLKLDHPDWMVKPEAIKTNHGSRSAPDGKKKDLPKSYGEVPLSAYGGIVE